jgi:myo-inositol-1(or 4)-monophosphatase
MFAHPAWSTPPNTPWPDMQIETRNSIAYRMALVAAGMFDAALVLSAKHDWDMAAGDLIVREAGGRVSTHDGSDLHFGGVVPIQRSMVCAGPALHQLLIERLRHVSLPQR